MARGNNDLIITAIVIGAAIIAYKQGLLDNFLGGGTTDPTTPPPAGGGGGTVSGEPDENGIVIPYQLTGEHHDIVDGAAHENGQRYNVNHTFHDYVMVGYYLLGSGGDAINAKTDGPNHGSCTSVPECLWVEPHLELSSGTLELQGEYPHPDSHPIPCDSCQSVGPLDAGQWIGWMVAAYGEEGPNRVVEVHVDPAGLIDGTTPANEWQLMCHENWMTELPSEYATRPLPVDFDEGLEMEIRLNNATSGDTQAMYARVYEIVPPTGTTAAYTRSYNTETERRPQPMVLYNNVAGAF